MFASLFLGLLDPATGSLIYANGGHEAPVILGPDGVKAYLEPTGPVVGIFPRIDFKIYQAQLEPGDILLAFTDGVTDALNPAGDMFTRERLALMLEQPFLSASTLLDQIENDLQAHVAGANQFDDITMLAVRRTPDVAV
jgi:serine phosphatase RsbU (regulator of sigma subunit)